MTKQEILNYIDKKYKGDKKAFYRDHPTMDIEAVKSASDSFYKTEKYKLGCFSVGKKYGSGTGGVIPKYAPGTNYVDYGEGEFGYQKMEVPPAGGIGNVAGNMAAGAQLGANFGPWGALAGAALGIGKGFLENRNIANQAGRVRAHNASLREFKRDDEEYQVAQAKHGLDLTSGQKATDYNIDDSDIDGPVEITNMKNKYQLGTMGATVRDEEDFEDPRRTSEMNRERADSTKWNENMDTIEAIKMRNLKHKFGSDFNIDAGMLDQFDYDPSDEEIKYFLMENPNYKYHKDINNYAYGTKGIYQSGVNELYPSILPKEKYQLDEIMKYDTIDEYDDAMTRKAMSEKSESWDNFVKSKGSLDAEDLPEGYEFPTESVTPPQYALGAAALSALPQAMNFFGVDPELSNPINSMVGSTVGAFKNNPFKGMGGGNKQPMQSPVQLPQQPKTFEMDPNQMSPNPIDTTPMSTDNAISLDTSQQDNMIMNQNQPWNFEKGSYKIANRGKKRIEAEGDEIVMRRDKNGKFFMKQYLKGPSHAEGGIDMIAEEGDVIFPKKMKKEVMAAYKNNDNLRLEALRSKLPKDTPYGPESMAKDGKVLTHSKQYPIPNRDITDQVYGYNRLRYQPGTWGVTGDYVPGDYVGNWYGEQTISPIEQDQSGFISVETKPDYDDTGNTIADTTPMQGSSMRDYVDPTKKEEYFRDRLSKDKLYLTGEGSDKKGGYNVRDFRKGISAGEYNIGDQKVSEADYDQWLIDKGEYVGQNQTLKTRDADEVYDLRSSFLKDMYDKYNTEQKKVYDPEVELGKPDFYKKTYDPWKDQFATHKPEGGDGPKGPGGLPKYPLPGGDLANKIRMGVPSLYNIGMGMFGNPDIEARRFYDPEQRKYVDMSAEDRAAATRTAAAAKKQGRDFYMSRGQRQGYDTQIDSRYLDAQGKINQNEARRFDQIDAFNKQLRNQAQLMNIRQADTKDDLDDRNRAAKQRMLAKGLEQQSDLGKFNRMEKFMRGREARLYDTDMKKLAIEAWKYGVEPEQLAQIMGGTGGGGGTTTTTGPTNTTTTNTTTTNTTPQKPILLHPSKIRVGDMSPIGDKIKKQIQETTDPMKKRELRKRLNTLGGKLDNLEKRIRKNLIKMEDTPADRREKRREFALEDWDERRKVRGAIQSQKEFRKDYESRENKRRATQNIRNLRRYGTY